MIPEFDFKETVQNKLSNDKISQLMAPVILVTVVIYVFFAESYRSINPIPLIIFAILVALEQVVLVLPGTKKLKLFESGGIVPLTLYNLSLLIVFVYYIPLYSPFIFVAAVIIFITVYFRGLKILATSIASWTVTVLLYTLKNGYPNLPAPKLLPYLAVLLGAVFAIVVQRAGAIDNDIRESLLLANDKVLESSEELNSLINGINESVIATDLEGKIHFYNSTSLNMLKVPSISANDDFSKYVKIFNEDNKPIDLISLVKENQGIKGYKGLHLIDSANQKINVSIDISIISIKQSQSSVKEIIFLIRDITDNKTLDEERDEFAAVASLELKTPIAAAETNIAMVMNKSFMETADDQTKESLKRAHTSIMYLTDLINELTELTNVEGPNENTTYEDVEPVEFIRQLYLLLASEATEKGLKFNTKVIGELKAIHTSRLYLNEILQNFLANAIKYSQGGEITLTAQKSSKFDDGILFSVNDSGPEIASIQQQASSNDNKISDVRGVGLGLYLALKLARYINAKVWFDSQAGMGTTLNLDVRPTDK
jgi:signal transduction histidine kinase